jgi:putative ABC transport system permease protein
LTPAGYAWRSLSREPARALLGIAGVAIVGALLFDMLMLSRGLVESFRDLLQATGYDVRVTATSAMPGMGPMLTDPGRVIAELRALPEVADVRAVRGEPASSPRGSRWLEVTILGVGPEPRTEGRLLRGRDLAEAAADEVVVNETLARNLDAEPGALLVLRPGRPDARSALPPTTFRVVGVAEFPFDMAGQRTACTSLAALRRGQFGRDTDEAELILVLSRPEAGPDATVAAIRRVRPDLHAFTIEEFLQRFRQGDFSYFRQISAVLTLITSFFAFLLVATLLTVSVNQRLGEVAALRALGFTRGRVARDLLAECALVVGSGTLLALPLGLALSRALDDILRGMPGLPDRLHFFVLEPRAVLLHLLLLGLAGVAAAAWPVLVAVRLPIAATLRREVVS